MGVGATKRNKARALFISSLHILKIVAASANRTSVSPAHETYRRLLLPHRHGYPLWIPEPDDNLCDAYRAQGVRIGDVGYPSDDGGFYYLFNICEAADHEININRTPVGFQPLALDPNDISLRSKMHKPNTDISSLQITKTQLSVADAMAVPHFPEGFRGGFEFHSSFTEGAILMLPDGATRNNLLPEDKFRDYAIENGFSWYQFVNEIKRRRIRNGSLYLITGRDNTASWGVASFSDHEAEGSVSLKFIAAEEVQGSGRMSYSWQAHNSISQRADISHNGAQNQCVFLRGLRIALSKSLFSKFGPVELANIVDSKPSDFNPSDHIPFGQSGSGSPTAGGSNNAPNSQYSGQTRTNTFDIDCSLVDPGPEGVVLEELSERSHVNHPCDVINDFLLSTNETADISIAHDNEWMSLVNDDDAGFPDNQELLRRLQSKYDIIETDGNYEPPPTRV